MQAGSVGEMYSGQTVCVCTRYWHHHCCGHVIVLFELVDVLVLWLPFVDYLDAYGIQLM